MIIKKFAITVAVVTSSLLAFAVSTGANSQPCYFNCSLAYGNQAPQNIQQLEQLNQRLNQLEMQQATDNAVRNLQMMTDQLNRRSQ